MSQPIQHIPRHISVFAAVALACVSLQATAFGTADDLNSAPLTIEFKKLDTNHDGKLSSGEAVHDQDFVHGFGAADTNHDGSLQLGEYSRYKSSLQQQRLEAFLDDSTVTAKVKAELIKDTGMKGLRISVETHKGQVILSGFVDNEQQIYRAAEIASSVRGVQSVKNSLLVKG